MQIYAVNFIPLLGSLYMLYVTSTLEQRKNMYWLVGACGS